MLLFDILNQAPIPDLTHERLDPLLDLAGDHGLIVLIRDELTGRGLDFPEWSLVADDLEVNARVQCATARELSAAFQAAKVDAVFAKGLALALSVYTRYEQRPFVDMDVLIEPQALKPAHDILLSLGYTLEQKSLNNPIECSYKRESIPGFPVEIDLHWSYIGDDTLQAPVRISIPEILSRTQIVDGIRIPSINDTILLAAANMPRKAAQPLMLLVDFANISRANFDRAVISKLAQAAHVRTGLWLGFELARQHLQAPVDPAFLKSIEPSTARKKWLLDSLSGELLWRTDKFKQRKYTFDFKLKCLDSRWDELRALAALPKGVVRKLGFSKTWSQKQLGPGVSARSPAFRQ